MFFVTPKGCPNHGLKLKLGKNYHSNNSIWLAVAAPFVRSSVRPSCDCKLRYQIYRPPSFSLNTHSGRVHARVFYRSVRGKALREIRDDECGDFDGERDDEEGRCFGGVHI